MYLSGSSAGIAYMVPGEQQVTAVEGRHLSHIELQLHFYIDMLFLQNAIWILGGNWNETVSFIPNAMLDRER